MRSRILAVFHSVSITGKAVTFDDPTLNQHNLPIAVRVRDGAGVPGQTTLIVVPIIYFRDVLAQFALDRGAIPVVHDIYARVKCCFRFKLASGQISLELV